MPLLRRHRIDRKMVGVAQTRQVHDFEVQKALEKILEEADLTVLTRKEVRRNLEKQFGGSFSTPEWKARIKQQIESFVQRREEGVNTHSGPHATRNTATSNGVNGNAPPQRPDSNRSLLRERSYSNSGGMEPPHKKQRTGGDADEAYFPPSHRSQLRNPTNGRSRGTVIQPIGGRNQQYRPRLQSNKQLVQKSHKDNSYFIKLPGNGGLKRCVMHKFRGKRYVGFREYYEKNGEELPTKKGM